MYSYSKLICSFYRKQTKNKEKQIELNLFCIVKRDSTLEEH